MYYSVCMYVGVSLIPLGEGELRQWGLLWQSLLSASTVEAMYIVIM